MKKMGSGTPRTLRILGLTLPSLFLLYACGILSPGRVKTDIECLSQETSTEGQLCGIAIRNILGPRDELVESVPLEQPELLVALVDEPSFDGDATRIPDENDDLVFSWLKADPSTRRILTDSRGQFSAFLEPGEYVLCVSYAPPWTPSAYSQQCARVSISKSEPTQIRIIFSPMAGLFIKVIG